MNSKNISIGILSTLLFILPASDVSANISFLIQDLGILGGDKSLSKGVNDGGTAVAITELDGSGNFLYPAYWENSTDGLQQIGTTTGDPKDINNNGVVVGDAAVQDGGSTYGAPFRYDISSDSFSTLKLGNGDAQEGGATGINDGGTIVGFARPVGTGGSQNQGFIWNNETDGIQKIGTESGSGSSRLDGINNHGVAVGQSSVNVSGGTGIHAIMYDPSATDPWTDLGTLNADNSGLSMARNINDNGRVVGNSDFNGTSTAFVYEGGSINALFGNAAGTTDAWDINNNNWIVGNYVGSGESLASLWVENAGNYEWMNLNSLFAMDLQSLYELDLAVAINNNNQIVANGYLLENGVRTGERRAFLLTPELAQANAVPEPATLILFAGGMMGAYLKRRS